MAMVTEQASARRSERQDRQAARRAVSTVSAAPTHGVRRGATTVTPLPVATHRGVLPQARHPSARVDEIADRRSSRRVPGDDLATPLAAVSPAPATTRAARDRRCGRGTLSTATACTVRPTARPVRVLVVVGLLTAAVVVLLAILGSFGAAEAVPARTTVVQVHPGDTVSGIAARAVPDGDKAAVMNRIEQLNGLTSPVLDVGQPLVVPVSDAGARAVSR